MIDMVEREKIPLNDYEPSPSYRILDRVVRIVTPQKYETFVTFHHLIRCTDNLVDEGESYQDAEEAITGQRRILKSSLQGEVVNPQMELDQELVGVITRIPDKLRTNFLRRYGDLLRYFEMDLLHRLQLKPYNKKELDEHIKGGFTSFFAGLKIILQGEELSGDGRYLGLTRVHGETEPLRDLAEDLERGLILHARGNGAGWVDKLEVGREVPYKEIHAYVVSRRGRLAKDMFGLAPAAFREFGGIIGFLMTVDYYKRSFFIARWRFSSKSPVIFADRRMLL